MDRVSPYEGLDMGSTPVTGRICHDSSVGRALGSYPRCRWFDPSSWYLIALFSVTSNFSCKEKS